METYIVKNSKYWSKKRWINSKGLGQTALGSQSALFAIQLKFKACLFKTNDVVS